MAKAKGSIIFEILIVLLLVALVATILYPKKVWREAEHNTQVCRKNMDKILKAELIYLKYHNNYEDTLDKAISFLENDTTGQLIMEYVYSDTALAVQIKDDLTKNDSIADNKVKTYLADTLLFTILQTTNYDSNLAKAILNRLEDSPLADSVVAARETDSSDVFILKDLSQKVPALNIISPIEQDDSLKIILTRIKPEITVAVLVDTLHKTPVWASKIDSTVKDKLESIKLCPTNNKPYDIAVIDTSVIKILNIHCPIDSSDIMNVKNDFVLYHLGHLRLENHGNIKGGEKSWLEQQ